MWSQSALCATAVGSESVYSLFDLEKNKKLPRLLTGVHDRFGFRGLEELFTVVNGSCKPFI